MDGFNKIFELKDELRFPPYDGFPDIELYMDQVLDFLSRSRASLRDDDKLSSAMVNNYIKAGLLPRARGKKYSREHLVHLAIILRLKQVLSVKDTGTLIDAYKEDKNDQELYSGFRGMVEQCTDDIIEKLKTSEANLPLIAMRLAIESYLSKIGCEYVIDQIIEEAYRSSTQEKQREKKEAPPKQSQGDNK